MRGARPIAVARTSTGQAATNAALAANYAAGFAAAQAQQDAKVAEVEFRNQVEEDVMGIALGIDAAAASGVALGFAAWRSRMLDNSLAAASSAGNAAVPEGPPPAPRPLLLPEAENHRTRPCVLARGRRRDEGGD